MGDSELQLVGRPPVPRVAMAAALGHTGAMALSPPAAGNVEANALLALSHREQVAFACECVTRALSVWEAFAPEDRRPGDAVTMAHGWLRDRASGAHVWTAARAATCATADARLVAASMGSPTAKAATYVAAAAVVAARHAVEPDPNTLGTRVIARCERAIVLLARQAGSRAAKEARVAHRMWRARRLATYLMRERR